MDTLMDLISEFTDEELDYLQERLDERAEERHRERNEEHERMIQAREDAKYCENGHYMSCRERRKNRCDSCEIDKRFAKIKGNKKS